MGLFELVLVTILFILVLLIAVGVLMKTDWLFYLSIWSIMIISLIMVVLYLVVGWCQYLGG